jgi:hypothetical protein
MESFPLHRRGRSRLAAALQPKTIEEAEIKLPDLIKLVQALPVGRLLSTGKGLIPNIRQSLYSEDRVGDRG